MTQCVPPPCPLLRCANERTKAILSATRAISGNVPPSVTPGRTVDTSPVTLRNSGGAVILGSNVSTCLGPPPSHSQTTDVSLTCSPLSAALARAAKSPGRESPPSPSVPTFKKSRRVAPSQSRERRSASTLSMARSPEGGAVDFLNDTQSNISCQQSLICFWVENWPSGQAPCG